MFLVQDKRHGTTNLVFTWEDPRKAGYQGTVLDGVRLEYDMEAVHSWPDGQSLPEAAVGRSPDDPKLYRVFRYRTDRQAAGFESVEGTAIVVGSWRDYVKLRLVPPDPEQIDEVEWFEYLDRLDEEWKRLRQRTPWPESPKTQNRDEVAAWLAKQHFIADMNVREICYFPQGAPADEIRFLELSESLVGNGAKLQPIDFGVELDGVKYRLSVADASSDQFEKLKADPSRLPAGWSIEDYRTWTRRRSA